MKHFYSLVALAMLIALNGAAVAKPRNGQTFNAWKVNCEAKRPANRYSCSIGQNITGLDKRSVVAAISIGFSAEKKSSVALIVLPLGIRLTNGVLLTIDGKYKKKIPFRNCDKVGCYVITMLDKNFISALKNGTGMRVTFGRLGQKNGAVLFSLSGFTAAFNSLSK